MLRDTLPSPEWPGVRLRFNQENLPLRGARGEVRSVPLPVCVHPVYHTFTPNKSIWSTMKAAVRPGRPQNQPLVRRLSTILSTCPALSSLSPSPNPYFLSGRPIFHRPANSSASSPLQNGEGPGVRFLSERGPGGEVWLGPGVRSPCSGLTSPHYP